MESSKGVQLAVAAAEAKAQAKAAPAARGGLLGFFV